jgi:NAD(P)-dependent dehydrogenase (short-subunit alcohol dehydrogenase family)
MQEFTDRVAVITGAASGIGRAIADKCAEQGMKLALADVEEEALNRAARELEAAGATVMTVVTDVSRLADVEALADKTYARYGAVHLLCNNAGVGAGSTVWESAIADWEWVLGVNLWGVIYGVKTFVPRMIAQDTECHIVNTASIAGLIAGPMMGIYNVSKHGVVALSETLVHELAERQAKVKISVLCPGYVNTRIMESARNRPTRFQVQEDLRPEDQANRDARRQAVEAGIPAEVVADAVFAALREDRFYIFTHPDYMPLVQLRVNDILHAHNPTNPLAAAMALATKGKEQNPAGQ